MSSWLNTLGVKDGWFSSMFAGSNGSAPGLTNPSISDMVMNLFEGKDVVPVAIEMTDIPKLPKATDLDEFAGIGGDDIPLDDLDYADNILDDLGDLDFPEGIRPSPVDVLQDVEKINLEETSLALRNQLERIIGSEIPVIEPEMATGEAWEGFQDMYDFIYEDVPEVILDEGLFDRILPDFNPAELLEREKLLGLEFEPQPFSHLPLKILTLQIPFSTMVSKD